MTFDPNATQTPNAKIKVIGVGGGGTNAVSTMVREKIEGVEFIAANTDIQSLKSALAPTKIQIGKELTKGLGAGSDPSIGRDAALEDRFEIQEAIGDADMVFITAGMGGGTGTGSAAIASQIAKESGALTVGVVTTPFNFEGKRRRRHAEAGIASLKEHVDTLITVPNQKLLQIASEELTMTNAFQIADNVLVNAVRGISDIINTPGTINVDFADVKTIMSNMGQALMGIGASSGENRAIEAAKQAISSPLLDDVDIEGATGILINITAGEKVSLLEVNEACMLIQDAAHEDANVIFGVVLDEELQDQIKITVIATGFPKDACSTQTRSERQQLKMMSEISSYNKHSKLYVPTRLKNHNSGAAAHQAEQPKAEPQKTEEQAHHRTESQTTPPATHKADNIPESKPQESSHQVETQQHEATPSYQPEAPIVHSHKEEPKAQHPMPSYEEPLEAGQQEPLHHNHQMPDEMRQDETNKNEYAVRDKQEASEDKGMNEKINEALELTERVKEIPKGSDDLDIPAFLRQNHEEDCDKKKQD